MSIEDKELPEYYVFWEYDKFPYVLGSGVQKIVDGGYVKVIGYGGAAFKPLIILPYEEGIAVKKELDRISTEYSKEQMEMRKKFKVKTDDVFFNKYSLKTFYNRS